MDFSLSDEQKMLIQTLRTMGERENFKQLAQRIDTEAEFPYQLMPTFASMGLLGMTLSEAYGGGGQPGINAVLAIEELAKFSPMIAAPVFESNVGPVRVIDIFGTEEHKRAIIPSVCRGERSVSVCMTEPEAGSDLTSLTTHAVEDGDDRRAEAGEDVIALVVMTRDVRSRRAPVVGVRTAAVDGKDGPRESRQDLLGWRSRVGHGADA